MFHTPTTGYGRKEATGEQLWNFEERGTNHTSLGVNTRTSFGTDIPLRGTPDAVACSVTALVLSTWLMLEPLSCEMPCTD